MSTCLTLITIDPGERHCGVAIWNPDKTLQRAYLCGPSPKDDKLRFLDELPLIEGPWEGVVEMPQRLGSKKKVSVERLIQLAASANAVVGRMGGHWTQARPGIWTQQWCQDKKIRLKRAWARLTEEEKARVTMPRTKLRQADVLDAIALGLWRLKR